MFDRVDHPPFCGGQQIHMRWSPAAGGSSHAAMVIRGGAIYPPPRTLAMISDVFAASVLLITILCRPG
jgi:hypothetical protein